MIECPFLQSDGSCEHVNAAVGLPIILHPSTCQACVEEMKPERRKDSFAVRCKSWAERKILGMEVGPPPKRKPTMATVRRDHKPRRNIAEEMMAEARKVPRIAPAPVVTDPLARLAICEEPCSRWRATNLDPKPKCRGCSCTDGNRPDPLAESGRDCPLRKWKRA